MILVAKELHNIHAIFDLNCIDIIQAPYDTTPIPRTLPISWPEMLLLRYRSARRLANYVSAWRSLLELLEADLIVYDSSPTALIASLGISATKWAVGSPFFMPRIDKPEVGAFPGVKAAPGVQKRLRCSEAALLAMIHEALAMAGCESRIQSVRDVVAQVDVQMITTIPQFDYFGPRSIGEYVGMPASLQEGVCRPVWPAGQALKVFAYLKGFSAMRRLLAALEKAGVAAVIYSREIPDADKEAFSGHVYLDAPASMDAVCAEADLVIHMAGSQTVARCMKTGVLQLLIVTGMEQFFTAKAAQAQGQAFLVQGSSQSLEEVLGRALEQACGGRRPCGDLSAELLDGSFYEQRVRQLLAALG